MVSKRPQAGSPTTQTHTHIHPSHPTVHCVCTLHTLTITHIYHIIHVLTWPGSMSAAAVMPGSCPPKRADAIRTQTRHRMAHCLYNRLLVRSIYARFVRAPGWCARAASLCGDRSATKTVVVVCIRPLHQAQVTGQGPPPRTGPTCSLSCMVRSGRGGRQGQKRRRRPGGGSGGRGGAGGNGGCGAGSRASLGGTSNKLETKLLSSSTERESVEARVRST